MDYNIATMSFKDTKVYQEAFEEVTVEQVAEAFDFSVEEVRQVAQSQP